MPFLGFNSNDFTIADSNARDRVRYKLAQFGREIVAWAHRHEDLEDLFKSFYVTERIDFATHWVAILPVPEGDERESLTVFPHVHLVLENSGSWFAINIEFENPRRVARDKLNPRSPSFECALQAIRRATGSQLVLMRKTIMEGNPKLYWWDDPLSSQIPRFPADQLTREHLVAAHKHIVNTMPVHSEPGRQYQPVLLLARFLSSDETLLPPLDFLDLSQSVLRQFAPFLRLLRY